MSKVKLAHATDMRGDQRIKLVAQHGKRAVVYTVTHSEISGETEERVKVQRFTTTDFAEAMSTFARIVTEQFQ
jgi:hypothetical protein